MFTIAFNWKDGSKTVTLAELEAAHESSSDTDISQLSKCATPVAHLTAQNSIRLGKSAGCAYTINTETGEALQIANFKSSHLDGNRPPFCVNSEPCRSPIVPVGDWFGFVRWVRW